jgi:hypothetical protein
MDKPLGSFRARLAGETPLVEFRLILFPQIADQPRQWIFATGLRRIPLLLGRMVRYVGAWFILGHYYTPKCIDHAPQYYASSSRQLRIL